jgi:lipoprotein-anchoring transpeptidase ErfK/SrfK
MSNRTSKLIAATLLAAVAATSFALPDASATNLPAWGEGVVLVPPAAKVEKASLTIGEESGPAIRRGKIVDFAGGYASGTIIIVSKNHALYLVLGNGKAVKYRVATGKKGFEWTGSHKVSSKVKWPDWSPPAEMRKRRPELPRYMAGGPNNPLGARAIYLGSSIYRIHGTNEPASIGKSASSGCIRMLNEDVIELFGNVRIGATVVVI